MLETSIDCHTLLDFTESSEFFGTILSIGNHYLKDIDFRPELGMAKDITNENLDKLLIPCIDSGVFKSIDLYGDETKEDFVRYKDYYKYAKAKGLNLKFMPVNFTTIIMYKKPLKYWKSMKFNIYGLFPANMSWI